jgi:hypothetical protein
MSLESPLEAFVFMLDIAYVALTVLFFALMLVYVRGCDALGRRQEGEDRTP